MVKSKHLLECSKHMQFREQDGLSKKVNQTIGSKEVLDMV